MTSALWFSLTSPVAQDTTGRSRDDRTSQSSTSQCTKDEHGEQIRIPKLLYPRLNSSTSSNVETPLELKSRLRRRHEWPSPDDTSADLGGKTLWGESNASIVARECNGSNCHPEVSKKKQERNAYCERERPH